MIVSELVTNAIRDSAAPVLSFTAEVERAVPYRHARPWSVVGIDLGVRTLLVGPDNLGNVISVPGPRPLGTALRKLRRASRACSRKEPGSANRRKSATRLARIHARAANIRADALHKATTHLARQYETVVIEDLNVAGMTRNHRLAQAICDQGFGQAQRMLSYKTMWNGGQLIVADRFYPLVQDLLGLRDGESQTAPVPAHLHLPGMRTGHRPGH